MNIQLKKKKNFTKNRLLNHLIQKGNFLKMGKIIFKYYYKLRRIHSIDHLENTKPNDSDYYFISFSEIKKMFKLYQDFKKTYKISDWYQVWQDLKETYPNTKIRIQDIEFIGPKILKTQKKKRNYLSVKNY